MFGYPDSQVYSPPELPPYLRSVCDLKPIVGAPGDDEVIGIHAVIRMAQQAVNVPGTGDPALIFRLSEHLFDVQMAKYRDRILGTVFPEVIITSYKRNVIYIYFQSTIYTPPTLPIHVAVQLEPVTGPPSEEEMIKVQSAIRSYQQFTNVPSIFDPHIDMELSQHLFDIQMASYTRRTKECHASSEPRHHPSSSFTENIQQPVVGEPDVSTNNIGTGANITDPYVLTQHMRAIGIQDAMERSNRLSEQANQLIERSNLLAERTNLLLERSIDPAEQPSRPSEHVNQLLERLNEHLDQSNRLAKESTQPVEQLGDALKSINRVLVRIQHAIVRNHKGNTIRALDCLVNEKGETPAISRTTSSLTFSDFSKHDGDRFPVVIDGVYQNSYIGNAWLAEFIHFYGIDDGLCEDGPGSQLKEGELYYNIMIQFKPA
ncbi:unnamed protein product [Rhizoctonia solani]|uniref:Laminin domain protein n=1 Tax=Rhizoctonia solani TaxID=456999 RepID=A0A8H3BLH4_9AGAM|nr:unnamed protein product [Rhizoctonia solani]